MMFFIYYLTEDTIKMMQIIQLQVTDDPQILFSGFICLQYYMGEYEKDKPISPHTTCIPKQIAHHFPLMIMAGF